MDQLIWHLLGTNQALGACVTSQMISVHPRLRALRSLADLWNLSEPIRARLTRFTTEAEDMSTKRNRTIHDKRLVMASTKEVVRFEITAGKTLKFAPMPESVTDLTLFKTTICEKVAQFIAISDDIRRELLSSQDTNRGPLPYILRASAPI
jgi:hypothetical protein